jgi:hypothetical protein
MLTALWTRVSRRFRFLLFVVIVSFVHNGRSLHPKFILTRAKFPISNRRGATSKEEERVRDNRDETEITESGMSKILFLLFPFLPGCPDHLSSSFLSQLAECHWPYRRKDRERQAGIC